MILDTEEQENLGELLENIIEFIEQTEKENTNNGMKLYDECNDWLIKLGK